MMVHKSPATRVICQHAAIHANGWHHADTEPGLSYPMPSLTLGAMLLCRERESQALAGPAQPSPCLQKPELCAASQPGRNHQASSLPGREPCAPLSLLLLNESGNESHRPLRLTGTLHRDPGQHTVEAPSSLLEEGRQGLFLVREYQAPLVSTEEAQIAETPRPAPAWPP